MYVIKCKRGLNVLFSRPDKGYNGVVLRARRIKIETFQLGNIN